MLVAYCTVPLPNVYVESCERFRAQHSGHLQEAVFSSFDQNRRIMGDGAPELNMSMAQVLLAQEEFNVILRQIDRPHIKIGAAPKHSFKTTGPLRTKENLPSGIDTIWHSE